MSNKIVNGSVLNRSAAVSSINEEDRTFEVTWTTGSKGLRNDWIKGKWYEELEVTDKAVRLNRLNSGAPLLDSHRAYGVGSVIGVIEKGWIYSGEGKATIRLSKRDELSTVWSDIKDKILRNVSVAYVIHKLVKQPSTDGEDEDTPPTYRAVDWEPMEISLVPIGFDAGAQIRSKDKESSIPVVVVDDTDTNTKEDAMADKAQEQKEANRSSEPKAAAHVTEAPKVDMDALKREAIAVERQRMTDIRKACSMARIAPEFADKLCASDVSIDEARSHIIDALAERDMESDTRSHVRVEAGSLDENMTRLRGIENALLHRHDSSEHELEEHGKRFNGLTLIDIGRSLLDAKGVSTVGLGRAEIAQRSLHSTSDFAKVIEGVANKTLRKGYAESPKTFTDVVRVREVSDFRTITSAQIAETPDLERVNEAGEYTYGTLTESSEHYKLQKYGKIIAVTREVILNDDLGVFADLPRRFAAAAARKESDVVWSILTDNVEMSDGKTLFHSDHGNLAATGSELTVASLGAAYASMRLQKGLDGRSTLNLIPATLVVPAALEAKALQYVSQNFQANNSDLINPYAGRLKVVVEPRLDAESSTAWYLVADKSAVDTIEVAYLSGQRGPQTESRNGFEVDGVEVKCRLDFAAKALDWRGVYKNPGA